MEAHFPEGAVFCYLDKWRSDPRCQPFQASRFWTQNTYVYNDKNDPRAPNGNAAKPMAAFMHFNEIKRAADCTL